MFTTLKMGAEFGIQRRVQALGMGENERYWCRTKVTSWWYVACEIMKLFPFTANLCLLQWLSRDVRQKTGKL